VLELHKDVMQARSYPSTTPRFVRGDKVTIVTSNTSLRGQPNRKLRDRQLGPFTTGEQIGKHEAQLKTTVPIDNTLTVVFHVNKLKLKLKLSTIIPANWTGYNLSGLST
jgi:hypothetical protein